MSSCEVKLTFRGEQTYKASTRQVCQCSVCLSTAVTNKKVGEKLQCIWLASKGNCTALGMPTDFDIP
jgi:hypothetical protein